MTPAAESVIAAAEQLAGAPLEEWQRRVIAAAFPDPAEAGEDVDDGAGDGLEVTDPPLTVPDPNLARLAAVQRSGGLVALAGELRLGVRPGER